MSKSFFGKTVRVAFGGVLLALSCGVVRAQGLVIPPVRQLVDHNGVDLLSDLFTASQTDINIGPPEALLEFSHYMRTTGGEFQETFPFWWSTDVVLLLDDIYNPTVFSVVIGRTSDIFDKNGSTFTSRSALGSTLAFDSSAHRYVYTKRDGTAILFPEQTSGQSVYPGLRALSIQEPDGTLAEFGIKTWVTPLGFGTDSRVQSVVNNAGYQLKLEYGSADHPVNPTRVSTLNRTLAYCDPTADACAATSGAPAVTLAWSAESAGVPTAVTATDPAGRVTAWSQTGTLRSAASSTDDTVAQFQNYGMNPLGEAVGVTSVTRRGVTWDYETLNWNTTMPTFRVTDPSGVTREVKTDLLTSLVQSDKDGAGNTTLYQYDSSGRRTRITYPEGNYVQISYDSRGNVTEVRKVAKAGSGMADIVTSALYPTSCDNPKTCNKPTSMTDARGQVTDYTYDPVHGGVLTVTEPAPFSGAVRPQTRYAYTALYAWYKNSSGVLAQASTPIYKLTSISVCRTAASCAGTADEVKTTFSYEPGSATAASNLLLISVTQASGDGALSATTRFAYDDRGNRTTLDGPLAGSADMIVTRYDILRRVVGVIGPDPDGTGPLKRRAIRYAYNLDDALTSLERGTVESLSDSDWAAMSVLETINSGYDSVGRRVSESLAVGGSTLALAQFSYNAASRPECAAERMNPATFSSPPASACTLATAGSFGPDRISKTLYDNAGRVWILQDGYGTSAQRNESTTTYTNNSNVSTVTDARNNISTFEYDGHDRAYKTRYPSSSGQSSTTDYEQFSYDAAGHTLQKRLRDGQMINFTYDNIGRLSTKDLPGSELDVAYAYDNLHHPSAATQSGYSLSFGYDALGRLHTQTGPNGTLTSDYDAGGRRTKLTWPDGFYVNYDYLVSGEMAAVRENGAVSGVGVLATFAYDNLARRTSIARGNGTSSAYVYDAASRFMQLTHDFSSNPADQTVGMSYNPVGQIASRTSSNDVYAWTDNQNTTRGYTPNSLNQYSAIASVNLSHDARGNTTNFGTGAFAYSSENRLMSAPGSVAFTYDPLGRLSQVAGATATRFSYDGNEMVAEYDSNGQLLRRYVHGPEADEPILWYEGSGVAGRRWLHADERGSIVAISNASGVAFAINRFDEYGQPAATNAGRFQFAGQLFIAEANLYYFKARFYAASIGRFMQTDPIGYESGMNLYAYAHNDPINRRDSLGLDDTDEIIVHGTRSGCGFDCTVYDPNAFGDPLASSAGQEAAQEAIRLLQMLKLDVLIDEIVVTGKKRGKLAGVTIVLSPLQETNDEQMWIATHDGTVIHVPTHSEERKDTCGHPHAVNVFEFPKGTVDIYAIIHTHTKWEIPFPGTGDYEQAEGFPVYGITPSSSWVLRKGMSTYGTTPEVLEGTLTRPHEVTQEVNSGTACRMLPSK